MLEIFVLTYIVYIYKKKIIRFFDILFLFILMVINSCFIKWYKKGLRE